MDYSTDDVRRLTNATERQLRYWVQSEWLHPSKAGLGSGFAMRWGFEDVLRARVMAILCPDASFREGQPARWGEKLRHVDISSELLVLEPEVFGATTFEEVRIHVGQEPITIVALGEISRALVRAMQLLEH